MENEKKLGATDEYPSGKLNDADEGELTIAVAADQKSGKILLQFGKPVAWLGMDADQARAVGRMLIAKADQLPKDASGLDWEKALNHFRQVRQYYQDCISAPGANTSLALEIVFKPLAARYYGGERTLALYEAMMKVE